jgi:hypothetical protein
MARLIQHHLYPTLPATRSIDVTRLFVLFMQFAVIGAIGIFLVLAIVNTVLGTPSVDTAYTYQ